MTVEQVIAERGEVYGPPEVNMGRIARLWEDYTGVKFRGSQVARMLALVKQARLVATPGHADSILDLHAYYEIERRLMESEARADVQRGMYQSDPGDEHHEKPGKVAHR